MTTIYDIAKRTGLAPSTVSKALNHYKGVSEQARRLVEEAARELHYIPNLSARMLQTKKSYMVGAVLSTGENLIMLHPHYSVILESFRQELERSGYDMLFLNNHIGTEDVTYLAHCLHRGLDGVMLAVGKKSPETTLQIEELVSSALPKVSVEDIYDGVCTVLSDNVGGTLEVLNYLYLLGHRDIALVKTTGPSVASAQREEGYLRFHKLHGLTPRPEGIIGVDDFNSRSGIEAARRIAQLTAAHMPTAVFCIYDEIAAGLLDGLRQFNIFAPQDISVVGFDDNPIAQYLQLTTVRQNRRAIGTAAANELLKQIENGADIKQSLITLETELVIRNSCGKNQTTR